MQKVKMLKSLHGVREGQIYPMLFDEGMEYLIDDSLVEQFMHLGGCELLEGESHAAFEEKAMDSPEENKAFVPEQNKAKRGRK